MRFFYIQVIWEDDLNARAIDQWTREIPVSAGRGNIYDRNGELLAGNVAAYSVYARANAVTDAENTATLLAGTLGLSYDDVLKKLTDGSRSEIVLVKRAEKSVVERIEGADLAGVYYARDDKRFYPHSVSLPTTAPVRPGSNSIMTAILPERRERSCLRPIWSASISKGRRLRIFRGRTGSICG